MLNSITTERNLLDGLLETLRGLPETRANLSGIEQLGRSDWGIDALIDLWVGGNAATLLIEIKKTLYPRDIQQALWRIQNFVDRTPQSVYFFVAQSISPGAKDLLREERVGYYDSGGSLFLFAANIYIHVDKPPPKSMSKSIRSLFSGRRAQVLQAVLMWQRGDWIRVKDVAEKARVSPSTASQVLTELERFDWMASRGQGPSKERQLRDPSALLDSWVNQLVVTRPLVMRRYFVPSMHVEDLLEKFSEVCAEKRAEYAITHEAAGQRYAPFLSTISQVRCRMLAGPAADEALSALDVRFVDRGANLAIIEVKSSNELLFRQLVNRTWLANPVQVYLDLMRSEGRSRDLAIHLRSVTLGF